MGFAKKSLGQNFLQDASIRQQILDAAGDIRNLEVLEIGPGLGYLTTKLLQQKCNLTAVELDPRAVAELTRQLSHKDNFTLIEGDILQQDIDQLYAGKNYRVIANIPYNITNPIIKKFLADTQNKPEYLILMVQKEVGEKIVTPKKKSLLSLSVEVFAEAEKICFVPRTAFSPAPKVDSMVIKMTARDKPLVDPADDVDFFTVLQAGFSQKRKKLGNYIGQWFGEPSSKLLGNIDENRRAETLSVEEWKEVMHNFQTNIK